MYKIMLFISLLLITISCTVSKPIVYVGNYTGSNRITKEQHSDRRTILINTTESNKRGSMYVYGNRCVFNPGKLLYIECNTQYMGALTVFYVYSITNGDKSYRLRQYRMDNKLFTQIRY